MFGPLHRRVRHAAGRRLTTLHALTAILARRRPVWMVSFAVAETNLSEGLRAACASTAMLLLGNLLHDPAFAWAAIGAFWTCLADAAGTNRMRLASMLSFALLSSLCGGLTAFVSGWSAGLPSGVASGLPSGLSSNLGLCAATAAILVFATAGALCRIWGSAAAQVGILAATACVVMVDKPMHDPHSGLRFVAIYLSGCLFALVLSLTLWRIHPFAPSRAAVRAVYGRLADMAFDGARLLRHEGADFRHWASHAATFRGEARGALETARTVLAKVPNARADHRATYENLLIALADTERLFAYLIAVTDACERGHLSVHEPQRAARLLSAMAEVARRIGRAIHDEPAAAPVALQHRLHKLAGQLETALGQPLALRLHGTGPLDFDPAPREAHAWWRAAADNLAQAWLTLKANATRKSIGLRHAARVGIAVTAGFAIVRALHLPFGYWATMATLLILQPSIALTWPRSIERAAGSIVGALLAAAIGLAVHSPVAIAVIVFPLICATMALRPVSYSLFVLFLTPTFVLVADFATPGASELIYALARLGNNVLGSVIALLATFVLWPSREPVDFRTRLADAVRANLAYLVSALRHVGGESGEAGEPAEAEHEVELQRRAAGLASNNAEESFNRQRLERLDSSVADRAAITALALLRRLAGTATRLRLTAQREPVDRELAGWIDAVSGEIDAHLRDTALTPAAAVFAREHLSLVEADAVNQVAHLRRLLVQNNS
ncbi:FUSC family protein [Paraburkholderia sp. DHOC27]|uniref:FUSC family protein n=1 Tax=Paraburkholderia sp. DHOC27 TaxID=2303330 RepID=UPI000E3D9B8F|nr:FUSC family protein [Paraburkholderia sp. DHOC27]RFU46537.1 FUSC family protein [Paraburkholderia sp. DHOC27]